MKMKIMAWPFVAALCAGALMYAQDSTNAKPQGSSNANQQASSNANQQASSNAKQKQLKGTICNSACVTKVENLSTCDTDCTDYSGSCVFVDNQGDVTKVANQDKCKRWTGKRVNVKGELTEKQREEYLRIEELYEEAP